MDTGLALFDFDGTISDRDSFMLFVRATAGLPLFCVRMGGLTPKIIRFLLGRYPNHALKEDVLTRFFRGWPEERFQQEAQWFCRTRIPAILRPEAMERLDWHIGRGDRVVIVSATPAPILAPWCREMGIELVATELETEQGRITGKIRGENCRGQAKVERIFSLLDLKRYNPVFAYGDTEGDRPMLALADHPYFRPFRGKGP